MSQIRTALKTYFGFDAFLEGQEEAVHSVIEERLDTVVIMPTGSGKSLCYQLTAMLLDGVTLVISPLIALMKDQVDALEARGLPATFINSSLSLEEMTERMQSMRDGSYKLVYVAPERFRNNYFMDLLKRVEVSMVAVDEAHCISQWGHDFRPDYLRLKHVLQEFAGTRVMALTATATAEVREDIIANLGLGQEGRNAPSIFVFGFARPNLSIKVSRAASHDVKLEHTLDAVRNYRTGIVYCSTRKNVERVFKLLDKEGLQVGFYHGGMSDGEREETQNKFMEKKVPVVVATNAFGMGVDRDDLRFIVHWDIPGSLEAYYQEIGRAGRDGEDAFCDLLYNYADVKTQEFFIEGANPMKETIEETLKVIRKRCSHGPANMSVSDWAANIHSTNNEMAVQTAMYILERAGLIVREVESGSRTRMIDVLTDAPMEPLREQFVVMGNKRQRDRARLQAMLDYVDTRDCRHNYILNYFGEPGQSLSCDTCDICVPFVSETARPPDEKEWEVIQKILSCVARLSDRFGKTRIAQVLIGSKAKPVVSANLHEHRTYGLLSGYPENYVKALIDELVRDGSISVSRGEYPLLKITPRGKEVAWQNEVPRLDFPDLNKASRGASKRGRVTAEHVDYDPLLFEKLRVWRNGICRTRGIPAYLVLADKSLRAIAAAQPDSFAELEQIWGLGANKLKQFGDDILAIVDEH